MTTEERVWQATAEYLSRLDGEIANVYKEQSEVIARQLRGEDVTEELERLETRLQRLQRQWVAALPKRDVAPMIESLDKTAQLYEATNEMVAILEKLHRDKWLEWRSNGKIGDEPDNERDPELLSARHGARLAKRVLVVEAQRLLEYLGNIETP